MAKSRVRMPSATSLVARSYPDKIIGRDNQLPWHLSTDMKHFRSLTEDHAVIMGRKTFESIGHPLPRRLNIILSRDEISEQSNLKWANNPETALLIADRYCIYHLQSEFYVIGGELIYKAFSQFINKVFLTDVFTGPINGDAKFEYYFDPREWWYQSEREFLKSERDDHAFRISVIKRRRPFHRYKSKQEFMGRPNDFDQVWEQYEETIAKASIDQSDDDHQFSLFDEPPAG